MQRDKYLYTYNKFVQTSLRLKSLEYKITTGVLYYNYVKTQKTYSYYYI
jgi:hypothetical protein